LGAGAGIEEIESEGTARDREGLRDDRHNIFSAQVSAQKRGANLGHRAGLLEPFVLLNRADNDITQDYNDYRAANRDKLRRYLDEFVVPKTPEKAPAENEN
jgi:hypothetical protein